MSNLCFIATVALVLVAFVHSSVTSITAQNFPLSVEDPEIHHENRTKRQIGLLAIGLFAPIASAIKNAFGHQTSQGFEKVRSEPGSLLRAGAIGKGFKSHRHRPIEEPVYNTNQIAYMSAHLVRNSNLNYEYCPRLTRRGKPEFMDAFPLASLAYMIYVWGERANDANHPNVHFVQDLPEPFTEVVTRTVTTSKGEQRDIPVYIRAIIRREHLPRPRTRTAIPKEVYEQMAELGNIKGKDDAGHGLAYSLGGGMRHLFNYFPQANRLNRHVGGRSLWLKEELGMSKFLMDNPTGRIEWDMFVIYDDPLGGKHRPVAFCLQHTDYDDNNQQHEGPELCFGNDPEDDCRYDQRAANNWGVPTPPPPGISG